MLLLQELKQKDYDKYLIVLLAPKTVQVTLTALFLFAFEISQIPVEVSEPMIGLIKLQWWKDAFTEIINGLPTRPHPILKGLVKEKINYTALQKVIDQYATLLEGNQPKNIAEVEEFLLQTDCVIINETYQVVGQKFNQSINLAYALSLMAKRLKLNSGSYGKFASQPDLLANNLIEKSKALLPKSNNVLAILANDYNQNPTRSASGIVLKLLLKRAVF